MADTLDLPTFCECWRAYASSHGLLVTTSETGKIHVVNPHTCRGVLLDHAGRWISTFEIDDDGRRRNGMTHAYREWVMYDAMRWTRGRPRPKEFKLDPDKRKVEPTP